MKKINIASVVFITVLSISCNNSKSTNAGTEKKENGKPIQLLRKGDVVIIQPGVKHWHGATPQNGFVQIIMNPDIKNGVVNWLERVTDEEYKSGK